MILSAAANVNHGWLREEPARAWAKMSCMRALQVWAMAAVWMASLALSEDGAMSSASTARPLHLASNAYSWQVLYARAGKDFGADPSASFSAVKASGYDGFEPILETPEDAEKIGEALRGAGLPMRSVYVNTTLHRQPDATASIDRVRDIASRARRYGARIVVTNPNPVAWDGKQDKTDAELVTQAAALNELGRALRSLGMALAYHNHDMELRQAARELHHMMLSTDSKNVYLCLDAHWIYRGAGNSSVALFDIVKLYGKRVIEVHVRQSVGGVWSEVFGAGDIDYARLAEALRKARVRPHLVLEQAAETGTPQTLDPAEAMRRSADNARSVFSPR